MSIAVDDGEGFGVECAFCFDFLFLAVDFLLGLLQELNPTVQKRILSAYIWFIS